MLKLGKYIIILITFIIISINTFILFDYKSIKIQKQNKEGIANYFNNKKTNFIAILKIPKISFEKGLTDIYNIDKSISFIKNSEMPEKQNATTIIAGHSGNNKNSYFKNLYKLKKGDYAYLFYNNIKYIYEVYDIKQIKKTGKLRLKLENYKRLVLITCKGKDEQIIIYFKLINC